MNRDDFKILSTGVIYFDNGATTLKPSCVVDSIVDYYTKYTANAHRGDYDNSLKVDEIYEGTRDKVQKFINAKSRKEIIFTSGTTDSINRVVFGFMKNELKPGDEVLITKAEHASNILPWLELEKELGIVVKYIPLDDHLVTLENVRNSITSNTKVISLAHVTNVLGDERPILEIGKICLENNIYFVVDGAQSVPHMKVDVSELNIDFLAFSAHKMLGPTGIGVLYGKEELLEKMNPVSFGGGMNSTFDSQGMVEYKSLPSRLESGTPNIAGVIGLGVAIDYLNLLGMDNIRKYEKELRDYCIMELKKIPNVILYNEHIESGLVTFNLEDVFSQDTAIYLNHYHICVRAGNHCAKILKEDLNVKNTCRISFYFYNTKEEIDKLVDVLKKSENIFKIVL
ncbi:MAG: cysteine desulfurase [Firmicutes bacterium]|nr:cysteine desulfurase [Bacillota bacterium]